MAYAYFIGCVILAIPWAAVFVFRRDIRKPMIWSGMACVISNIVLFIPEKLLFVLNIIHKMFVPDYWNPKTFFDLGQLTGGLAIEDILFMFIVGGLAVASPKIIFKKKFEMGNSGGYNLRAIAIAIISFLILAVISGSNLIYPLIIGAFIGAVVIWIENKNLITTSLVGGLTFLIMYFLLFLVFNTIFPDFISQFYNIKNISGILVLSVPLEELLFAFSFGLMWSPIYEYAHGKKIYNIIT